MAGLGATIALGRPHDEVWDLLGIEPPGRGRGDGRLVPRRAAVHRRLREAGYGVFASGNAPAFAEADLRPHFDGAASAERWGVWKPAPEFFERVVDLAGVPAARIAYVGDRVDYDVGPAIAAGMAGVHVRRGPWGYLQEPPASAIRINSLDELPGAFA